MPNQGRIIRLLLVVLSAYAATACRSNALGNHLYLMEGDQKEDRIIVYCSKTELGECLSGIPVIPRYERQYAPNGHYAEYMDAAVAEREWVMVRTVRVATGRYMYWLIRNNFNLDRWNCARQDCDGTIQHHVIGPLNYAPFTAQRTALELNAPFK